MSEQAHIAITGTGLIASLGRGRGQVFEAVASGRVGLGPMPALEQTPVPDHGGGQAVELRPSEIEDSTDRAILYLRAAVRDALADAGLTVGGDGPHGARIATVLGSTLHGMRSAGAYLRSGDTAQLASFLAGATLDGAVEGIGVGGLRLTTCAACSSGLSSVGLGMSLLRAGLADAVIAGGYDTVSEYAYAGFNALRLVTPESLRPFGRDRRGMKTGEGYGVLVLERLGDARARGAEPLALVGGYAESSDTFHLTQPRPDGAGAAAAIRGALGESGLGPADLGLVSAHATGTPANDAAEYAALELALGEALPDTPVVGLKGALGHTLGGAGAVELILALEAMRRGVVPPTHGAAHRDGAFPRLRLERHARRGASIRATLNLSLGFGGSNTAVVLREDADASPHAHPERDGSDQPVITGVGVVLPGLVGFEAFARLVLSGAAPAGGPIAGSDYAHLLEARRLRRVSEYARLSLASAGDAARHAGLGEDDLRDCGAVLGTSHGSSDYCERYYGQIVREGLDAANPVWFAEGVPNAAAAHLSMGLGLRAGCQTIIGTRTAGLEALALAALRVREGRCERCLVTAAEEHSEIANTAHERCGLASAGRASAGAVSFVVEARRAAEARGARVLARLGPCAWAEGVPDEHAWRGMLGDVDELVEDRPLRTPRTGEHASGLCARLPELYSVTPLAAIGALLARGPVSAGVVCHDFVDRACGQALFG
ncbi:MAG: beta-ketoacyl synthase N-terminal-like domain-containing protein [Phycisphaerales bacterium JB040]